MPINEASAASPVLQQGGTWLFTLRGRCCGQNETIPARTTGMGTGNSDEKTWRTVLWSRDGEGNLPKEQGGPSRTAHPTEIPKHHRSNKLPSKHPQTLRSRTRERSKLKPTAHLRQLDPSSKQHLFLYHSTQTGPSENRHTSGTTCARNSEHLLEYGLDL